METPPFIVNTNYLQYSQTTVQCFPVPKLSDLMLQMGLLLLSQITSYHPSSLIMCCALIFCVVFTTFTWVLCREIEEGEQISYKDCWK